MNAPRVRATPERRAALALSALLKVHACAAALIFVSAFPSARAAEKKSNLPRLALGCEYEGMSEATPDRPLPMIDPSASEKNPLYLRLELRWSEIEKTKGRYDWATADAIVDRF